MLGPGTVTDGKRWQMLKSHGPTRDRHRAQPCGKTSPGQREDLPPCSPACWLLCVSGARTPGTTALVPSLTFLRVPMCPTPAPHGVLRHRSSPLQRCPSQLINTFLVHVFRHVCLMRRDSSRAGAAGVHTTRHTGNTFANPVGGNA